MPTVDRQTHTSTGYTDTQRRQAAVAAIDRRSTGIRKFLGDTAAEWSVSTKTLRTWIDEFLPETVAEAEPAHRRTPYPLRGIAWCSLCRRSMLCGRTGTDHVYLCAPPCPRRTAIIAAVLHGIVLQAVSRQAAQVLRHKGRGDETDIYIVPGIVHRISVGADRHLTFAWRPYGYDRAAADRHAAPWHPPIVARTITLVVPL